MIANKGLAVSWEGCRKVTSNIYMCMYMFGAGEATVQHFCSYWNVLHLSHVWWHWIIRIYSFEIQPKTPQRPSICFISPFSCPNRTPTMGGETTFHSYFPTRPFGIRKSTSIRSVYDNNSPTPWNSWDSWPITSVGVHIKSTLATPLDGVDRFHWNLFVSRKFSVVSTSLSTKLSLRKNNF